LSLAIAGIAYKRWKKIVKLTEGSEDRTATSVQFATEEETSTVVRLLGNIQLAFQNAEKITDKFDDVDLQSSTTFANDLAARANAINHNRQSKANIWQKTRWVFHDKAKLEDLER
jgi:pterin-4a-carbinolamine dehydratase